MTRLLGSPRRGWEPEADFLTASEFVPPADIYEDADKLTYKMEIPGIKPENLNVCLEGNTLTVSGEHTFDKEEKRENFRQLERRYGLFSRSFDLPPSADREHVTANFENGLLRIEVAKRAEARGRRIQIEASEAVAGTKGVRKAA